MRQKIWLIYTGTKSTPLIACDDMNEAAAIGRMLPGSWSEQIETCSDSGSFKEKLLSIRKDALAKLTEMERIALQIED